MDRQTIVLDDVEADSSSDDVKGVGNGMILGDDMSKTPESDTPSAAVQMPSAADLASTSDKEIKQPSFRRWVMGYCRKWRGTQHRQLKHWGFTLRLESIWSLINSFLGMLAVTGINYELEDTDYLMVIGSFGATAVLVYSAWQAPLAQPRNVIGGHVLSAIVGVTCRKIFQSAPQVQYVAASLAVAISIVVMEITATVHPPGGATALIAVTGSPKIYDLGYMYVLIPVMSGACIMVLVALVTNNLSPNRSYPVFWW